LGACFLIFSKKIKKQAPKHHCISPPEAAKYFLQNPSKKISKYGGKWDFLGQTARRLSSYIISKKGSPRLNPPFPNPG
jgi:hypothetical protein